uniref:Uncharacterized protein n=1 Tax=Ciona savignyi TaxID=51511 RepID=H2Z357_CIOSA
MLWRTSTRLGCSVAVRRVRRGGHTYNTTYTIAHYDPAGNHQYTLPQRTIRSYHENVPDPKIGTCMSPEECSNGDRCMGFDSRMTCRCQTYRYRMRPRQPICSGSGGCMVRCTKPTGRFPGIWRGECQGQRSCKCSLERVNNVIGAICI